MASKCLTLVKGRRIRVTRLDECFRPVFGEYSQAVSKGFISVALTANTSETDEINVTNAAGEVCLFEPSETSLTGYAVEITFCEVDPELFALVTGQEVYLDYNGDGAGFTVNTKPANASIFGLELWAGSPSADTCSDPDAEGSYGYLLLPALKGGIVGDFTVENGAVTFTITGATTRDGNSWGVGPYLVMRDTGDAAVLPSALDPNDHLLTVVTTVAPPEPLCGARPLLDPSVEPITAVAGIATLLTVAFETTPDDIAAPVWYDFGDGTWDYLAASAMGATSHTYAAAGTYTVRASTNGVWVSTTVTVTA